MWWGPLAFRMALMSSLSWYDGSCVSRSDLPHFGQSRSKLRTRARDKLEAAAAAASPPSLPPSSLPTASR
jgi:hypothetical protein